MSPDTLNLVRLMDDGHVAHVGQVLAIVLHQASACQHPKVHHCWLLSIAQACNMRTITSPNILMPHSALHPEPPCIPPLVASALVRKEPKSCKLTMKQRTQQHVCARAPMICRNSCLPTTCLALFPEKLLNPLTTNMHCPQTGRYLQLLCVTVPAQTCVTAVTIHEYAAITSFSAVLCTLPKNA